MFENMMDELDCGNFFDNIDDILDDFPIQEDIESVLPLPNCDSFASFWPNDSDSLTGSDSVFSAANGSDLSAELSVPYDDIVQLEWLSNFVEDSFASGEDLTMKKEESPIKEDSSQNQFRSSSPISVLESSSSCSGGEKTSGTAPESPEAITPGRCGRARSKRPRPATFNPRPAIQLMSPVNPSSETSRPFLGSKASSDPENFVEYRNIIRIPKHVITEHKKKKKMRLSIPLSSLENNSNEELNENLGYPVRKCMHCEITKTPQWRAGPMGPKTLCNACGVRFKSGRLFPEYRPAASPTFVPSLHSNSHKKVVEMRSKNVPSVAAITKAAKVEPASPVLIPNNNISLEYN